MVTIIKKGTPKDEIKKRINKVVAKSKKQDISKYAGKLKIDIDPVEYQKKWEMNGNRIFVDTNILIYYLKGNQEVDTMISDKDLVISFITELELLSLPNLTEDSLNVIHGLLKNCFIVDLNNEIKKSTIEFRKISKLKLPDSIIAASSNFFNLPLITADKQFKNVTDLEVILYES